MIHYSIFLTLLWGQKPPDLPSHSLCTDFHSNQQSDKNGNKLKMAQEHVLEVKVHVD
jgi:hypothetical protein